MTELKAILPWLPTSEGASGSGGSAPTSACLTFKLTADADVSLALGIGEGVETTLSLRLIPEFGATTPVWSLLNAGGIAAFPVLGGVEALWIAVDHDPAGVQAAGTCAARWRDAGHEAFLVKPNAERTDLNDLLTMRGRADT